MNRTKFIYIFLFFLFTFLACHKEGQKNQFEIRKGAFEASLTETGNIHAVNSRPIIMPYVGWRYGWRYKIIGLLQHGTNIEKGDSIAQIDPSSVMQYLIRQENELEVQQADLNQMLVTEKNRINNLKSQLTSEQLNFDLKKLELERFKFESENKRKVKELEFEQSKIRLNKIKRKIELSEIVKENNLKIQRIRIEKIRNNIDQAERALTKLTIRSPSNGILQLEENRRTDQLMKIGDEIWQGRDFASVPDLSKMKVKTSVNEKDIHKINLGQEATITLEAFPEKRFEARVSQIGKLSRRKSRNSDIKVFDIEVIITESDPILKPGMTVRCKIIYANLDDALYVNNRCIKKEEGRYYIFRKDRDEISRLQIVLGPSSAEFTVIYGNIKKGQKLMDFDAVPEQM